MTDVDDDQLSANRAAVGGDAGMSASVNSRVSSAGPDFISSPSVLESLAPRYEPDQHATYLWHLQQAVEKPKNLNIALTGRYGTGKSSVLDEFESRNKDKTLRLAISALGPNPERANLTNRIQKEVVKQLLYRAAPRDFRFSRFNRIVPLSRVRAAGEAVIAVAAAGSILAFLGWLPGIAGTGPDHHGIVRVLSWLAFAALIVGVLTAVRLVIYGRFVVSDVSAAGAAVKLTQRTSTYFDEYLDEIVYFFDEVSPDIVIFEDLDRFDDPHIFEALRELNTLLNQTAKRREKNVSLRFIYAIKDSLFERLGSESEEGQHDAAAAETIRANRTKFFDIVIPMVPFISHRNARELLAGLLQDRGFTNVERALVTLVARHATDMRLLRNICNEYAVFAERLLASGRAAPGLTVSNLFALVAYKNFHLEDFEEISRRNSDLDVLYDRRRELVRAAIDAREKRKRDILNEPARFKKMASLAKQLGNRLEALGLILKSHSRHTNWRYTQFWVNSDMYSSGQVESYEFWVAVASAGQVSIMASIDPGGGQRADVGTLNHSQIQAIFPEVSDASRWAELDEGANRAEIGRLDGDIEFLRGADFQDLARESRFTLAEGDGGRTFAEVIDATIKSKLGCDLVKMGYLDRNFTLYAAQFYGEFTGVDVANFIVQTVQTNTMDIDYLFSGPEAITNLLPETPEDFSRTISAYNVQILDYLLERNDPRAEDIADTITSNFGDDAKEFLRAYLNSGAERARFAALLSKRPWLQTFTYLVQDEGVPADVRPTLVNAALGYAKSVKAYELNAQVRDFIVANYRDMAVFASCPNDEAADKVVAFIKHAGVILPSLSRIDETLRLRVVHEHLYVLTAENLREALGVTGDVSFDRVCENVDVYDLCQRKPNEYLATVQEDVDTPYAVSSEVTLAKVLTDVVETWEAGQVRNLITMAAPESRLERLDKVPALCWPELATHHLFRSTVHNVRVYGESVGNIDNRLAALLVRAGGIDAAGEGQGDRMRVAIDVLNAADIPAPQRIRMVASLDLDDYLPPSMLESKEGELLALLLEQDLIEDSLESFTHFRHAGWETIGPAIRRSTNFAEFMTPELVSGFVADLLRSDVAPRQARDKVVENLAQYVPNSEAAAFSAAGQYVLSQRRSLPLDQVRRVAACTRDKQLTLRLLAASPMPSVQEIIGVLAELGEPYSFLTSRVKHEFDVPSDEEHRTIFDYLKEVGQITEFRKRRMKDVYVVKLA